MFLNHSREAFQNIQGKIVDIPTLKAATVNTDAHVLFFLLFFFFKSCSQNSLKSVTDVNKNTQTQSSTLVVT